MNPWQIPFPGEEGAKNLEGAVYVHASKLTDLKSAFPFGHFSLFVFLLTALSPASLGAQSVGYTSVTTMEFGGPVGAMMRMVPDMETEVREETFIKGSLMRTDNDQTGTIVNMGSGVTTFIQHEDEVYYTLDMREMGERFQAAAGTGEEWEEEESDLEFDVTVNIDRTGRTRSFDGYSAEQVLMTMEMVPRNEEAMESMEESGSMVVFTELWLSTDFPAYEAMESMRADFTEGGISDQGAGGYNAALTQAFSQDPKMRDAFERNMEEMRELEGMPVKTVTSMVLVPVGQEFDPDAVLEAADQPLEASGGMGDLMGQAAGGAARQALGRMGGMLGRGRNREREEEPQGRQSIMTRVTSVLQDVRTSGIPDSLFSPPEGYQEQTPPWMGGGPGR
jgi:hypothetical protein